MFIRQTYVTETTLYFKRKENLEAKISSPVVIEEATQLSEESKKKKGRIVTIWPRGSLLMLNYSGKSAKSTPHE